MHTHTHTLRDLSSSSSGSNGYAQTKWMAESLIHQAIKADLSATIYRLGLIGPGYRSGIGNPRDLHTLLFIAILRMPLLSFDTPTRIIWKCCSCQSKIRSPRQWLLSADRKTALVWFGYDDDQETISLNGSTSLRRHIERFLGDGY